MYNRNQMLMDLKKAILDFYFGPINGIDTHLKGTLMPVLLPQDHKEEEEIEFHKNNSEIIRCWDVVHNRWQLFRPDALKYVSEATP